LEQCHESKIHAYLVMAAQERLERSPLSGAKRKSSARRYYFLTLNGSLVALV
jgi:hypothetical protein